MTYFASPAQIMQLSFSSDKVYPAYWEMHGVVSYLNGYAEDVRIEPHAFRES
ncbi:hypothetical protein FACS1894155_12830 [Bacteroidia bacterium]|nr:hypothetical protein FACS1894155_12830 [Bacteroidia bacterium]